MPAECTESGLFPVVAAGSLGSPAPPIGTNGTIDPRVRQRIVVPISGLGGDWQWNS